MPEEPQIALPRLARSAADRKILELGQQGRGVVSRRQLLAAGIPQAAIARRVNDGWLIPLYPGVYAVGHTALTREARMLAAVVAIGPGAVLSHQSAGALHGLRPSWATRFTVTVARSSTVPRAGILVYDKDALDPADVTVVDGVPVTTVARTIVDLAGVLTPQAFAKVLRTAEQLELFDLTAIDECLARTRGRRGPGHVNARRALAELARLGTDLTRSGDEDVLLDELVAAGFPRPCMNFPIDGDEVDAVWPQLRLGIELDSWRFHKGRRSFVRDRAKLRRLLLQGWLILPFTHADLEFRRQAMFAEVAQAHRAAAAH